MNLIISNCAGGNAPMIAQKMLTGSIQENTKGFSALSFRFCLPFLEAIQNIAEHFFVFQPPSTLRFQDMTEGHDGSAHASSKTTYGNYAIAPY